MKNKQAPKAVRQIIRKMAFKAVNVFEYIYFKALQDFSEYGFFNFQKKVRFTITQT